jgi:hypothetical protein
MFEEPWFELWDKDVIHFYQLPWFTAPHGLRFGQWRIIDRDEDRNDYLWVAKGTGKFQWLFVVTDEEVPPSPWFINLLLKRKEIIMTPGKEMVSVSAPPKPIRPPRHGKVTPEVIQ